MSPHRRSYRRRTSRRRVTVRFRLVRRRRRPTRRQIQARNESLGVLLILAACLAFVCAGAAVVGSLFPSSGSHTSLAALATEPSYPTDTPLPPTWTPAPRPTCILHAVNCNPWGYNLRGGHLIYSPPAEFCSYFACIATFWDGSGYVVKCADGQYSLSGGHTGSCSRHGGEWQPLYA